MTKKKIIIFAGIIVLIALIGFEIYYFSSNYGSSEFANTPVYFSYHDSTYNYDLGIPWDTTKFQINSTSPDKISFIYTGAEPKTEIFSIVVLNNSDPLNGAKEITSKNGKVFAYSVNSGNPYSGNLAQEFDTMKNQVKEIINAFFKIK